MKILESQVGSWIVIKYESVLKGTEAIFSRIRDKRNVPFMKKQIFRN